MSDGKIDAHLEEALRKAGWGFVPVLLLLKDGTGAWSPPAGFLLHSRLGEVVAGRATKEAIDAFREDDDVLFVEASRAGGHI